MDKVKITLLVFTLNEEKNIEKLLKSVKWVNNIIVIDSGSKDKTTLISRKYTDKIFIVKSKGYVESIRNVGISKVKTDWILILDADEELTSNSKKTINRLILNKKIDGYWFPRRNYLNQKEYLKFGYFYPDWQLRFFRNFKGYWYSGKIHEPIKIPSSKTRYIKEIEIYHNPSRSKYNSFLSFFRLLKYIKIEARIKVLEIKSIIILFKNIFLEGSRHFYRSFIRKKGYKDGYSGFRAAIIFSLYQSFINLFAICYKFKIKK